MQILKFKTINFINYKNRENKTKLEKKHMNYYVDLALFS